MRKIEIVIMLIISISSCYKNEGHINIPFTNNTDVPIDVTFNLDYPSLDLGHYPIHGNPEFMRRVMPHTENSNTLISGRYPNSSWEGKFEYYDYDTLTIQVFESRVVDNYSWVQMCSDNMILQRYFVSLDDLTFVNWAISYPPTPEMQHIKMWPPYEEAIKNAESLRP